jgi:hypothetical protein
MPIPNYQKTMLSLLKISGGLKSVSPKPILINDLAVVQCMIDDDIGVSRVKSLKISGMVSDFFVQK